MIIAGMGLSTVQGILLESKHKYITIKVAIRILLLLTLILLRWDLAVRLSFLFNWTTYSQLEYNTEFYVI